jgi:hypothetical protein
MYVAWYRQVMMVKDGLGFGLSPPSLTLQYDDIIAGLLVTFITQSWEVLQGPIISGTAYGEMVGGEGRCGTMHQAICVGHPSYLGCAAASAQHRASVVLDCGFR